MERGVFDIEAVKKANADLIGTIQESLQIADEGKAKRAAAEEELKKMENELRDTLVACNRCCCTDTCARWIAQGHPGTPHFCRARTAFQKLELASTARPRLREAAE